MGAASVGRGQAAGQARARRHGPPGGRGGGRGGLKVEASELADGLDSGTEGESVFRIF